MTQEEKVRQAVKVADELIKQINRPTEHYGQMWLDVFAALVSESPDIQDARRQSAAPHFP